VKEYCRRALRARRLNHHLLVVVALALVGKPALGDVIEITPTGNIVVYKGPTQIVGATTTPLSVPASPDMTASTAKSMAPFPSQMHPVLAGYLVDAATRMNVDPELVQAIAWQESRFDPQARSPKGAIGIMQLMPATARQLGVNPYDPQQNIQGGVAYLRALLTQFNGDVRLALAAYNAGPNAVLQYGGIPPFRETQNYVKSIAARLSLR
jgi:soluble lytic murein transglycosylase-like protein